MGVRLALPRARTVCYVENDIAACGVLVAQIGKGALDDAPVWTDARTFDGKPWRGVVDILIAGYPCKPYSVSGKRLGADDERDLWPEVLRIVSECQPRAVFLENVEGHLRLGYFDIVEPNIRELGYGGPPPIVVAASDVGAPHLRKRMFALHAKMDDAAVVTAILGPQNRRAIQNPDHVGWGNLVWPQIWPPGPADSAGWSQLPDDLFPVEPYIRGVADGVDKGLDLSPIDRIRILGNGVVPQQAALAMYMLSSVLTENMASDMLPVR